MTSPIDEDIDRQLRQWAGELRAAAPTVAMPDLEATRRRRWVPVLAAAAAVAAVGVGATLIAGRAQPDPQPADSAHGGASPLSNDPLPPGPGRQEFSYRGLAVDVPPSWLQNSVLCGRPQRDTVYVDAGGPIASCSAVIPTSVQWIVFSPMPAGSAARDWFSDIHRITGQSVSIDGVAAVRSEGTSDAPPSAGRHVVTIAVPSLRVLVSFVAPSAARARQLSTTLHRVPQAPTSSRPDTDSPQTPTLRRVQIHAPTATVVHLGRTYSESLVGRNAIATGTDGRTETSRIGANETAVLYLQPGSYEVTTSDGGVCSAKKIDVGASDLRVELSCALP